MLEVESGGDRWKPWPRSQPISRSTSSWSADSMPSATTSSPSVPRELDDHAHERALLAPARDAVDERLGDLQHVERERAQVAERRVAGPEVVEREAHAELVQLAQRGAHPRVDEHALGDLERRAAAARMRWRRSVEVTRSSTSTCWSSTAERFTLHADVAADRAAAGLVEHELADRHDQAGLLGQRDELAGRDEAALRVVPAHERLGGDDVAGRRGARSAGTRPRTRSRSTACWSCSLSPWRRRIAVCMLRSKRAQRPLPRCLASYMATSASRISSPARIACGVVGGDADARADADRLVAGRHALGERGEDPLGDHDDVLRAVEAVEQDRELVAAEARDGVGRAHALAQALGDRDEQLVADRVAERVVDGLEVVDVDEQHGDGRIGLRERLVDAVDEQRAVGQPGQRVVVGLVLELALELAQLPDRLLEAVVLERDRGVGGERLEQPQVGVGEVAHDAGPVGEQHRADHARLPGQHREHRVRDPALLEVAAQAQAARLRA